MRKIISAFLMAGILLIISSLETPAGAGEKSPPVRIQVEVDAREGLKEEIEEFIRSAAKNKPDIVLSQENADRVLRIISFGSAEARIYCDSIITLSVVNLDAQGRLESHFASTFPSENLRTEVDQIIEKSLR